MADFILNMPPHFFARVFGNPAGDPVLLKSRGVTLLRDTLDGVFLYSNVAFQLYKQNADNTKNLTHPKNLILQCCSFLFVRKRHDSQDKIDQVERTQEDHKQEIKYVPRSLGSNHLYGKNSHELKKRTRRVNNSTPLQESKTALELCRWHRARN